MNKNRILEDKKLKALKLFRNLEIENQNKVLKYMKILTSDVNRKMCK